MRQIIYTKTNKVNVVETPDQSITLQNDQVVVDVKAIGINFADILAKKGLYPDAPPFPAVVGYEFAGVVVQLGPDVDGSWLSKDVFGLINFGGYADRVVVSVRQICEKPSNITMAEAASIPIGYVTAYFGLLTVGGMRKGDTVLIQNAGGGLGLAALDVALHVGATVIGTASGRKHDMLKERGMHHTIDYNKEDFSKRVMEITQGKGVDVILDPMGAAYWNKDYKLLAVGGRLVAAGASELSLGTNAFTKLLGYIKFAWQLPWYNPIKLMNDNHSVAGINLGHAMNSLIQDGKVHNMFADVVQGIKDGWVRPYVDSEWPMEKVEEAHAQLEQRQNMGKVILTTTR